MAETTLEDVVKELQAGREVTERLHRDVIAEAKATKKVSEGIYALIGYMKTQDAKKAADEREKRNDKDRLGDIAGTIAGGFAIAKNPSLFGLAALIPFAVSLNAFLNRTDEAIQSLDRQIQGGIASVFVTMSAILAWSKKMTAGIAASSKAITSSISTMVKPISGVLKGVRIALSPLTAILMGIGAFASDMLKIVVGFPLKAVGGLLRTITKFSGFLTAAIILFDGIVHAVQKTWDKDKNFFLNVFNFRFIGALLMGMWDSIVTTVTGIIELVVANIPFLFGKFLEGVRFALRQFGVELGFLDGVIESIHRFSQGWRSFIQDRIVPFLENVLDPRNLFSNVMVGARMFARATGHLLLATFKGGDFVLSKVKEGLQTIRRRIGEVGSNIRNFLVDVGNKIRDGVVGLIKRFNPFESNEKRENTRRRDNRDNATQAQIRAREDRILRSQKQSAMQQTQSIVDAIDKLSQTIARQRSASVIVSAPATAQTNISNSSQTFMSAPMSPDNQWDESRRF